MNIEAFRAFCIAKPGVSEGFPFDGNTLVFKVGGKMFALADVDLFTSINLKCDPDRAVDLREEYTQILPGFHMNKKHWNTVILDGQLSDSLIYELIDHSYQLVYDALPGKIKDNI